MKSGRKHLRIFIDEIRYIKGNQNYVDIHTEDDKITTLMTLKRLEEVLPSDRFIRTHKSYIVALRCIREMNGNQVLVGKEYLPVSKSRKEEILKNW